MKRIAQIMYVNKNSFDEYERRHNELWPEMKEELKKHGANNYSIFLNKSNGELFAYLEVPDINKYNEISQTAICKKWWDYMEPLMETNADNSPVAQDLKEVFHLN